MDESTDQPINKPEIPTNSQNLPASTRLNEDEHLEKQVALLTNACEAASKQYEDYYKSFAALDGKAQSTSTISGFLLASVVAFVNAGRLHSLLSSGCTCNYLLALLPPLLALSAVIVSIIGAKVRDVVIPFNFEEQIAEAEELLEIPREEFSGQHLLDYQRARISHWKEAIKDIDRAVSAKSAWVVRGQWLMVLALAFLLVLFAVTLAKA